ncbi:MAG: phosphatidylserine decarboxylase [Verrucomicrobiota bacterium]
MTESLAAPGVYMDGETGDLVEEKIVQSRLFTRLYAHPTGRFLRDRLMRSRALHRAVRAFANSRLSRPMIRKLVNNADINLSEAEFAPEQYACFNAFFTRRLKPDVRTIDRNGDTLVAPADGKLLAFDCPDTAESITVKGIRLSVAELLDRPHEAIETLCGGQLAIIRLYLGDYHRFHVPVSGRVIERYGIPGHFYSVSPFPGTDIGFYKRKIRRVTEIENERFGRVTVVAIGGFLISSIQETSSDNRVEKGEEMGYFEFGGSTLVVLTERGRAGFHEALLRNSRDHLETYVKLGSAIASGEPAS